MDGVSISISALGVAKELIQFLKRRGKRKIPVGEFIKMVEKKYTIKLSRASKIDLIESLCDKGLIKIVTSRYGKKYVILGGIRV
jgi:hypothetical protein